MLLTVAALLAAVAHAAVPADLVTSLPGFGAPPTAWYSGYLSFTGVNNARLHMHYVFQTSPNAATDPVTVWMNGEWHGRCSIPSALAPGALSALACRCTFSFALSAVVAQACVRLLNALTFTAHLANFTTHFLVQAAPAAPASRA